MEGTSRTWKQYCNEFEKMALFYLKYKICKGGIWLYVTEGYQNDNFVEIAKRGRKKKKQTLITDTETKSRFGDEMVLSTVAINHKNRPSNIKNWRQWAQPAKENIQYYSLLFICRQVCHDNLIGNVRFLNSVIREVSHSVFVLRTIFLMSKSWEMFD